MCTCHAEHVAKVISPGKKVWRYYLLTSNRYGTRSPQAVTSQHQSNYDYIVSKIAEAIVVYWLEPRTSESKVVSSNPILGNQPLNTAKAVNHQPPCLLID